MRKLAFLISWVVLAQSPSLPPGMRCPQRTVAIFEEGPNIAKSKELYQQHIAYMQRHLKTGEFLAAGPTDGHTAIILLATKDWGEAEGILKDEPFTRGGVLKIASHYVWNACEAAK